MWGLPVHPVNLWVPSGFFASLSQPRNIHVRLFGDSELGLGVSVRVEVVCLCVGPAMDQHPV